MNNNLHTVLGANGAVAMEVIKELQARNLPIRAVSRKPKAKGVECVSADLLKKDETIRAVEGSAYVYLCVGLPYSAEIWERDWEIVLTNVIDACEQTDARLIFLDNIYMYGPAPLPVPFDENTSQHPQTRKGKVRRRIANLFLSAMEEGRIRGLIGRSADFYGEGAIYSPFYISFLERMLKGKAPQSIAFPGVKHTYAEVGDNGRALVELALADDAYGQVWHLPVGEAVTMEEMTTMFNQTLGTSFKVRYMPGYLKNILSLFIPLLKEALEMSYQYEHEYVMSWEKFGKRFPEFKVTSYEVGVRKMVEYFK